MISSASDTTARPRPRGFLILFAASGLLSALHGSIQLAERHSDVDLPLGVMILVVALASAAAFGACGTRSRRAFALVVVWAIAVVVAGVAAGVAGPVLLRRYLPGFWNLVPGPVALTLLAATVVRRGRGLRADEPSRSLATPAP